MSSNPPAETSEERIFWGIRTAARHLRAGLSLIQGSRKRAPAVKQVSEFARNAAFAAAVLYGVRWSSQPGLQERVAKELVDLELPSMASAYMAWLYPVFVPSKEGAQTSFTKSTKDAAYEGFDKVSHVGHAILSMRPEISQLQVPPVAAADSTNPGNSSSVHYIQNLAVAKAAYGAVVTDLIRQDLDHARPGLPLVLQQLADLLLAPSESPKELAMDATVRQRLIEEVIKLWTGLMVAAESTGHMEAAGMLLTGGLLDRIIRLVKANLWQAGSNQTWINVEVVSKRALLLGAVVFAAPAEGQVRRKELLSEHWKLWWACVSAGCAWTQQYNRRCKLSPTWASARQGSMLARNLLDAQYLNQASSRELLLNGVQCLLYSILGPLADLQQHLASRQYALAEHQTLYEQQQQEQFQLQQEAAAQPAAQAEGAETPPEQQQQQLVPVAQPPPPPQQQQGLLIRWTQPTVEAAHRPVLRLLPPEPGVAQAVVTHKVTLLQLQLLVECLAALHPQDMAVRVPTLLLLTLLLGLAKESVQADFFRGPYLQGLLSALFQLMGMQGQLSLSWACFRSLPAQVVLPYLQPAQEMKKEAIRRGFLGSVLLSSLLMREAPRRPLQPTVPEYGNSGYAGSVESVTAQRIVEGVLQLTEGPLLFVDSEPSHDMQLAPGLQLSSTLFMAVEAALRGSSSPAALDLAVRLVDRATVVIRGQDPSLPRETVGCCDKQHRDTTSWCSALASMVVSLMKVCVRLEAERQLLLVVCLLRDLLQALIEQMPVDDALAAVHTTLQRRRQQQQGGRRQARPEDEHHYGYRQQQEQEEEEEEEEEPAGSQQQEEEEEEEEPAGSQQQQENHHQQQQQASAQSVDTVEASDVVQQQPDQAPPFQEDHVKDCSGKAQRTDQQQQQPGGKQQQEQQQDTQQLQQQVAAQQQEQQQDTQQVAPTRQRLDLPPLHGGSTTAAAAAPQQVAAPQQQQPQVVLPPPPRAILDFNSSLLLIGAIQRAAAHCNDLMYQVFLHTKPLDQCYGEDEEGQEVLVMASEEQLAVFLGSYVLMPLQQIATRIAICRDYCSLRPPKKEGASTAAPAPAPAAVAPAAAPAAPPAAAAPGTATAAAGAGAGADVGAADAPDNNTMGIAAAAAAVADGICAFASEAARSRRAEAAAAAPAGSSEAASASSSTAVSVAADAAAGAAAPPGGSADASASADAAAAAAVPVNSNAGASASAPASSSTAVSSGADTAAAAAASASSSAAGSASADAAAAAAVSSGADAAAAPASSATAVSAGADAATAGGAAAAPGSGNVAACAANGAAAAPNMASAAAQAESEKAAVMARRQAKIAAARELAAAFAAEAQEIRAATAAAAAATAGTDGSSSDGSWSAAKEEGSQADDDADSLLLGDEIHPLADLELWKDVVEGNWRHLQPQLPLYTACCHSIQCSYLWGPTEASLVTNRGQRVCGGCGVVRYCSKDCAERSWEMHKAVCKKMAALPRLEAGDAPGAHPSGATGRQV